MYTCCDGPILPLSNGKATPHISCFMTPMQCYTIIQLIIAVILPPHSLYLPKLQFVMVTERSLTDIY